MEMQKEFQKLHKRLDRFEERFATKDDLKAQTKELEAKFATKEDLKAQTKELEEKFATKDDLKAFATKDDLKAAVVELKEYTDDQTELLALMVNKNIVEPLEDHFRETAFMKAWRTRSRK